MLPSLVFRGTIIISVPKYGVALVAPEQGAQSLKPWYLAHLPLSDATTGAITQSHLIDGTAVWCIVDHTQQNKAYIIAPASYAETDFTDVLESSALYGIDNFTENDDDVATLALAHTLQSDAINFRNVSHGADIDAVPGDTDIIDLRGNAGLHVGRYVAQLRGSPMAYIDASNLTNTIRVVAEAVEQHLPLSFKAKTKELTVNDIAITDAEAFGVSQGNPLVVDGTSVNYADEAAIPVYRLQNIAGAAADGIETIIIQPPTTNHYCTTEPYILAKERIALTGELSKASAVGVSSIKSPAIQALQQVNYDVNRSQTEQDDILQPYKYVPGDTQEEQAVEENDRIDDAAINKIIDRLLTGDYLEKLKEKLSEHGLKVSSSDATIASQIKGNWKTGPSVNQAYEPPDKLELVDPVSGKITTYYNSTSFISQEPDGSILLCDGYGSEIRMSRGNIYISPALDLFLRPGRDLSAMVPRHQSYNAQGYTTINTSKAMYLRSVGDLKMVGATGEHGGMVTLECYAENKTASNGLLLKSATGATLVGKDIYIGRNRGNTTTENNVLDPQDPGTIIIDACSNGVLSLHAKESTLDAESAVIIASNEKAASAFRLAPAAAGLYTNSLELPASVSIIGKQAAEKISLVRDGNVQEVELTTAKGAPRLVVEGFVLIGGVLMCNGAGHFSGQITANGVGSISQYCSKLDTSIDDPFKKTPIPKLEAGEFGGFAAGMVSDAARYMYQDVYVTVNGFAFPDTYGVPANIRVPGMKWQTVDRNNAATWSEAEVWSINKKGEKVATMCYPGVGPWHFGKISMPGYELQGLYDSYTTNTIKE